MWQCPGSKYKRIRLLVVSSLPHRVPAVINTYRSRHGHPRRFNGSSRRAFPKLAVYQDKNGVHKSCEAKGSGHE